MPSAFTHIFVGEALGKIYTAERMHVRFWVLAGICSALPDVDVIGFYLGVRYGDVFGHRGFTHSLLFALLVGFAVVLFAFPEVSRFSRKWWGLFVFFFVATASHGLLDALTSGGYGISFFSPFDTTRYFLPWKPIKVSPMGVHGFLSRWGWNVIKSEIAWVWIPLGLLAAALIPLRRKRLDSESPESNVHLHSR